ncbi:MAG: hypothetical protein CVV44_15450 [Spirochaetae bacterium HGW-Spirochaetae-1]|jgi:hypothetical protein|nr:MAG: hypothetical protein CVV44_15450 [Spirochaetae bacterium HGW-Spirochaetae-1]
MNSSLSLRLFCLTCLIVIFIVSPLTARDRLVYIRGLSIYNEKTLLRSLGLSKRIPDSYTPSRLIREINSFYREKGYILVRTYIVAKNDTSLELFVDEGRLGRIVFYDLNTYDMLRVKYDFTLKNKIYNKPEVDHNVSRLKEKFDFSDVNIRIVPAENYDNSLFQIDRDLNIPILGRNQIEFFDKIGYRYNMEVYVTKKKGQGFSTGKKDGFAIKVKSDGTRGLMPIFRFYQHDVLQQKDFINAGTSMGLMYGWDYKFDRPPHITYLAADADYHFPPMLMNYFTPLARVNYLTSNNSRKDLGIEEFRYSKIKGLIIPGLTLLEKLKLYLGAGIELSHLYNSVSDPSATAPVIFNDERSMYYLMESELKLELLPDRIGSPLNRSFSILYDLYGDHRTFHKLQVAALFDFAFERNDILALASEYTGLWGKVPYSYEQPVTDSAFKGFQRLDIYTNSVWSLSSEYRFSIYRDFVYLGIFIDTVLFQGSGYDYSGLQSGLAGGISGRFIVLDQFEWTVYYSRDWLIKEMKSQNNFYFRFVKKW